MTVDHRIQGINKNRDDANNACISDADLAKNMFPQPHKNKTTKTRDRAILTVAATH